MVCYTLRQQLSITIVLELTVYAHACMEIYTDIK